MNEIEIIARAQMYLEKLANGVNPLTDEEVAENDVVNNVRISRCLYYVTGILKQITTTGSFEIQKSEFSLSAQQLERFAYSQTPLTVSEITKRLNELVNPLQCSTLKNGVITEWLTEIGMLTNVIINNKSKKRVTDNGRSVEGSTYEAISYNLNAQNFIVDNIHSIIELNRKKATKADEKRDG